MAQRIEVRASGPQPRRIANIVAELVRGGLIAYPTDSGYALGWRADNRKAAERVVRLRQITGQHQVRWDGLNDRSIPVSSGVYFYQLKSGDYVQTKKLLMIR